MTERPPEPDVAEPDSVSRLERHRALEAQIQGLDDEALLRLIAGSDLLDRGHATLRLPPSDARVFVKLLPLTALELQPRHRHSTANLFQLPPHYHYRIGSCGFGTWRELEAHLIANAWVLSGQCPSYPLLHGWRVLPLVSRAEDDRRSMTPWGNDAAIRRRLAAIEAATSSVVLFLEYFPQTLSHWLADRLAHDPAPFAVVAETEATLLELLSFGVERGFLHMDAHFENVLADGRRLFLGDFGLAISETFSLDPAERAFVERHKNFDPCTALTSHVHAVVSRYDASDDWRRALRELLDGSHSRIDDVPEAIRSYLARRGPVALATGEFYRQLLQELETPFPTASLQRLLDRS